MLGRRRHENQEINCPKRTLVGKPEFSNYQGRRSIRRKLGMGWGGKCPIRFQWESCRIGIKLVWSLCISREVNRNLDPGRPGLKWRRNTRILCVYSLALVHSVNFMIIKILIYSLSMGILFLCIIVIVLIVFHFSTDTNPIQSIF